MIPGIKKFKLRKLVPAEKMAKARVMLLKERPFFGTLLLYLKFREVPDDNETMLKLIPTMGIDKWGRLFYNPKFVDKLTLEKLTTVVCHEVYHAVLRHIDRKSSRDQVVWNYAADYVVNGILVKNGFKELDDWLFDKKYDDCYSEEVFEDLNKKSKGALDKLKKGQFDSHLYHDVDGQSGQGQGDGDEDCDNCGGSGKDPNDKSGQTPCPDCGGTGKKPGKGNGQDGQGEGSGQGNDPTSQPGTGKEMPQWDKILREAYSYAKKQGKAPLGMDRILEGLVRGTVPWYSLLRKYITYTLPKDYTYMRPHRRSQSAGFYMPTLKKEEIDIAIAIDTSGSVSDTEYKEFISEIVSMENAYKGRINFFIVTADAAVQTIDEFKGHFDPTKMKARGYGGTLFKPAFDYLKENRMKTKLLVYFTDLFGDQDHINANDYPFQCLWVLCENCNSNDAPFGTTVRMHPNKKK